MKRITFVAATAALAIGASATDFNCNPSTARVLEAGAKTVDYITLSEGAIKDMEDKGVTVNYVGPAAELGRNLWYWENTFIANLTSFPRVDEEEGGCISVEVGTMGWSGAGIAVDQPLNLSHFNDNTHFHIAYITPSANGPKSIALIILDSEKELKSIPAKVALGAPYEDQSGTFATVGDAITDEWQGLDMTFGELRKFFPTFAPTSLDKWTGNLFSFLGGGVAGQTLAFDAIYFYTTETAGVESVSAPEAEFVVTDKTINVNGTTGIELYNMGGALVKSTNGTVLGIDNVAAGVYVARSGNTVRKVVVR